MKQYKIVVEKHSDTYVAYPLGMKGVVVGQGDTFEAALVDVKPAIKFHIDTFGSEDIEIAPLLLRPLLLKLESEHNVKVSYRCSCSKGNKRIRTTWF